MHALENRNKKLKSFKGIGRITLLDNQKTQSARMAWMGLRPEKLRIEILGSPGQRTASISSDGKWLYWLSPSDQRFYKKRLGGETLEKLVSLPVSIDDIRELLAGRAPVLDHDHAMLGEKTGRGEQYLLILNKREQHGVQRILMDAEDGSVRTIERFDAGGRLVHRIDLDLPRRIEGFLIPFRVVISNDKGVAFQLHMERYWADVPVEASVFVLNPPEERSER